MIRKQRQEIVWLEFELLQQFSRIKHGIFLRHGGVSQGVFSSLNVSGNEGDDKACVEENRKRIMQEFTGMDLQMGRQVHGSHVEEVSSFSLAPCDGLFTREPNKALMVRHADCQAAIFYDPKLHMIANVHSGWKGSVQNIYKNTIDLYKSLGSDPANLFVCISPSLGPNKAEFINYKQELPESFWHFSSKECFFDFWEISQMQLQMAGVLPEHIQIAKICTHENAEDYFSYRRDKKTGRHATVVALL